MRWAAAGLAGMLMLPALVIGAAMGVIGSGTSAGDAWSGQLELFGDIPPSFLALYTEAASRFAIPAPVLAAVGKVECDHGRDPACATPNPAGAVGPMQFLPTTFVAHAGASGDPNPSILDPRDAIFAAAAKLAADGVNTDPWAALFAYNHSDVYVAQVLARAVTYGWVPNGAAALSAYISSSS